MESLAHPSALEQIEDYKEHLFEVGRSRNTVKAYIKDLIDFAELIRQPLWPAPSGLDTQIQRWLAYRRSLGDSVSTLRRRIFSVKSYYHYAGIPHLLTSIVTPKSQWYLPKVLANPEVERLMAELSQTDPEAFEFFKLILLTGFKFTELYDIVVTEADILNKKVKVVDDRGQTREVILGDTSAHMFTMFLERGGKWNQSRSRLMKILEITGMIAGVRNATSHTLRATCAARMLAAGHKKAFVKANMGYRTESTINMIQQVSRRELIDNFSF